MQVIDVVPSDDTESAAWIGPRLRPFESCQAGSVVPGGFDLYARIDHPGRIGVLPADLASALVEIIGADVEAWLALWNGYGWLGGPGSRSFKFFGPPAPDVPMVYLRQPPLPRRGARLVHLPNRAYFLYRGTLDQVPGWMDGPNLWWPDDRSWCVASEIDLPWTYVGGPKALIAKVLADERLGPKPLSLDESTLARDHPELGERP